jgi:hypothetical protein
MTSRICLPRSLWLGSIIAVTAAFCSSESAATFSSGAPVACAICQSGHHVKQGRQHLAQHVVHNLAIGAVRQQFCGSFFRQRKPQRFGFGLIAGVEHLRKDGHHIAQCFFTRRIGRGLRDIGGAGFFRDSQSRNGGGYKKCGDNRFQHGHSPKVQAATFVAFSFACNQLCICCVTSRPSRIAQTTRLAPRTMSPMANTPSRLVICVV